MVRGLDCKAVTVERAAEVMFEREPVKVEQPAPGVTIEHHIVDNMPSIVVTTPQIAFFVGELARIS